MFFVDILSLISIIIIGVGVCFAFVVQFIKRFTIAIKEKDFGKIMELILDLIPEAEERFSTGAERKEYVMSNIKSISATLGYKVDEDRISEMIDAVITLTKKVNK